MIINDSAFYKYICIWTEGHGLGSIGLSAFAGKSKLDAATGSKWNNDGRTDSMGLILSRKNSLD